jgi:hypothetical protein
MADTEAGPDEFTPAQWQRFGEFVRHALHAAVDDLEPQASGLPPIRAQIWADSTARERVSLSAHEGACTRPFG